MTATGFLLDNVSNTGQSVRQALSALLPGGRSGRGLGSVSGVRPGGPGVVSVSGSTWTVAPVSGVLDVASSGVNGPVLWAITAQESGTIPAADATYSRNDLLSVQVDDPTTGDGTSAPAVRLVYATGTPSASPADPASPPRSLKLCRLVVPKAGGGTAAVSWLAPVVSGGGLWFPTTAARDAALTAPTAGMRCETGTGSSLSSWLHDGASWQRVWMAGNPPRLEQGSGSTALTSGAGNTLITFAAPFSSPPAVVASPASSAPLSQSVCPGNITTTGFTLYAARTDGASTSYWRWVAVGS